MISEEKIQAVIKRSWSGGQDFEETTPKVIITGELNDLDVGWASRKMRDPLLICGEEVCFGYLGR